MPHPKDNESKSERMNPEKRSLKVKFEVREKDGQKKLVGMPIVYGKNSEDLGWFTESIRTGAAADALRKSDPRLLYGHNSDSLLPLARKSAGTLRDRETEFGVEIEADPPDSQFAKDLIVAIERGDVQDMSFGFTVKEDSWGIRDGKEHREIIEFDEIFDFSYVTYPAYNDTSAATRSFDKYKKERANSGADIEGENLEIELLSMRAGRI